MRKLIYIFFILPCGLLFSQNTSTGPGKQGYVKKKDERTNKLIYEGEFKNDKPVGKFKYYYPNDSVRAIMNFKNEGSIAYVKLFHENGKRMAEGKYVGKETKDSVWAYYDAYGTLISKERYALGKKDGQSFVYYPDGTISEERNYTMDVQNGPFKQYFNQGKAVKGQGLYVNGQLTGRVAYYYPNGVEVAAGFYRNGVKNGPWIYREESGKIKEKELFKNGKQASPKETEQFFSKNKTQETPKPAAGQNTVQPKPKDKTEAEQSSLPSKKIK